MTVLKKFFLTGLPGCGKTTLVERVIERLGDQRLGGFYTRELRGTNGRRIGFEAIGLRSGRTNLAHVHSNSKIRVGRYGVEREAFEKLINDELASDADVDFFVVDECASSRKSVGRRPFLVKIKR